MSLPHEFRLMKNTAWFLGALTLTAACRGPVTEPVFSDYPIIDFSSTWLEFGDTENGEPVTRTFTIQNQGDLALGVGSIEAGLGMGDNFSFTFDAEAGIVCPEGDEEEADTGSATAKSIGVPPLPAGVLTLDKTEVDFGTVAAGSNSTQVLNISNTGDEVITLSSVFITPADGIFTAVNPLLDDMQGREVQPEEQLFFVLQFNPADDEAAEAELGLVWDQGLETVALLGNSEPSTGDSGQTDDSEEPTDDTDEPIEPESAALFVLGADCTIPIEVTFDPVGTGQLYGSLIVETMTQPIEENATPEYYSDLDHARTIVYLEGEGILAEGRAIVRPRSVDFGHLWTGEDEVRYIEVQNVGDGDLELTAPTFDENCSESFTLSWTYAEDDGIKMLEAGGKTLLEVTYVPDTQSGSYCTLYVHSNDDDDPEVAVYLSGNAGVDPANEPPTVEIRQPGPGYMHTSAGPIPMELNIFDRNQPASSLTCRVNSAINVGANVADCQANDESGHVELEIDLEPFDPGVDTLLVRVTDVSGATTVASISVLVNGSYPESDDDGDGFGTEDTGNLLDCNDSSRLSYPRAAELFDGLDNDCDEFIDEGTEGADDDQDGLNEVEGDCDDEDNATRPGATEAADHKDNDCDGRVDEETNLFDDDGDGYAEVNNDCHDGNPDVNPGAPEVCDNLDNDCNGRIDDNCLELDSEPMIIGGISMSQTACEQGETIELSTFVYDADGQELTYNWTLDKGTLLEPWNAASVDWTAQEELENPDGEIVEVWIVARDPDSNQVWDFSEVSVYPRDTLYQPFVTIEVTEPVSLCSAASGRGMAAAMVLAGLGMMAARRRRD